MRRYIEPWGKRERRTVLILSALLALLAAAVICAAAARSRPSPAEAEAALPDYITRDLLEINPWSRPGEALKKVRGIVLHYVGNPGLSLIHI